MEDLNFDLDEILNDGGSIEDIIGSVDIKADKGKTEKKEKVVKSVDYQSYSVEDSVVLDASDVANILKLARAIPSLNELSSFVGMEVVGDKLSIYVSNVTEYIKSDFQIRNTENRMEEGTFVVFPIDTLMKALRASTDVVTIFKKDAQYRVSVIGGSIPIENNASVKIDNYKNSINLIGEPTILDVNIYNGVVDSLYALAASAVSLQQKKINIKDGFAVANFLRCLAKKSVDPSIELGLRVIDVQIISRLLANEKSQNISVYKNDSRLTYKIGNSIYSCVETQSFLNVKLNDVMDVVLEKGVRAKVDIEEIRKISSLLTSLQNVEEVITLKEVNGRINIFAKISGEENTFTLATEKMTTDVFGGGAKLNAKMFDSAISSYSEDVVVYLSEEGIIFETSDKRVLVGAELF